VERYADSLSKRATGQNNAEEERIDQRFPGTDSRILLVDPAIIVDCFNRILAWYVPDALTDERKVGSRTSRFEHLLTLEARPPFGR